MLESNLDVARPRPLPPCPVLAWSTPVPLNKSAPSNLYKSAKLLSVNPGAANLDVANIKINKIPGLEPLSGGYLDADLASLAGVRSSNVGVGGFVNDVEFSSDDEGSGSGKWRGRYLALILILFAVVVVACQLWDSKTKPKRRRNRLRRLLQAIGHRVSVNNV